MKKITFLLPGVLAFALFGVPMFSAQAQSAPKPMMRAERMENKLNLTDAQKAQMQQIRETTKARMLEVLTDDQKAQLEAARQQGQKGKQVFESLNLTEAQQQQMRAIKDEAYQQKLGILNEEQRQMMEQKRQQWEQRRGQ